MLNDISQHIFNIKSGSSHLLWNETGCCHSWCGVHLQQVDLLAFGNNLVNSDYAVSTDDVING